MSSMAVDVAVRRPRRPRPAVVVAALLWLLTLGLGLSGVTLTLLTPAGTVRDPNFAPSFLDVLYPVEALGFATVGLLIVSRRPNLVGWLMCVVGVTYLVSDEWARRYMAFADYVRPLPASGLVSWLNAWVWLPDFGILLIGLPLLFPNGRLLSPRWRWPAAAACLIAVMTIVIMVAVLPVALNINSSSRPAGGGLPALPAAAVRSVDLGFPVMILCALAAVGSMVIRYRRSGPEVRHQLKWITASFSLVALSLGVSALVHVVGTGPREVSTGRSILDNLAQIALLSLPIAVGVAVLRYRLFDIDVIISRSLLYGGLAGFITGVYVAVVVGLGSVVGTGGQPNLALSILATAIIAVAFQPARRRLQRLANRLVYGQRATPYEVVAEFAHRMAGTLSVDEVLPRMAETAARGVGATHARVRLFLPDGGERASEWPDNGAATPSHGLTVVHDGEAIGEIAVTKRVGEPLTLMEGKLLRDLAAQAELALHNVRLTSELETRVAQISAQSTAIRGSRLRLVSARDVERRRLEQTLHDGVQRQLSDIAIDLATAARDLGHDPNRALLTLDALTARATATLDDLRDVARGIFPPLLADQGVVPALEAHLRKLGIAATVDTDATVAGRRFAQPVEAAVYFCCVEMLRLSGGDGARLQLSATEGWLDFAVLTRAVPDDQALQGLRDRVEALGGSLEVGGGEDGLGAVLGRVPAEPAAMETVAG